MNIFQRERMREANQNIKIEDRAMLMVYASYKSMELHLQGRYDIIKYSKLKNLTNESFDKESGDLKAFVRALNGSEINTMSRLRISLYIAAEHLLNGHPRASLLRGVVYKNEGGYIVHGTGELEYSPKDNFLFENENNIIERLKGVVSWVKSMEQDNLVNLEFFEMVDR